MAEGVKLPKEIQWADNRADVLARCETMQMLFPRDTIAVVLQKGFANQKPMRWTYKDGRLIAGSLFDRTRGTPIFPGMEGADVKARRSRFA
jgi:hypothetical protein